MRKQPITLANGEDDGFAREFCDKCEKEALVRTVGKQDWCDECTEERRSLLEERIVCLLEKLDTPLLDLDDRNIILELLADARKELNELP